MVCGAGHPIPRLECSFCFRRLDCLAAFVEPLVRVQHDEVINDIETRWLPFALAFTAGRALMKCAHARSLECSSTVTSYIDRRSIGQRQSRLFFWAITFMVAHAASTNTAFGEEEVYDVADEGTTRWLIDSYHPKFIKVFAALHGVSYEQAGLVSIGQICGDRQFFPKRFKQFKIAVPLPGSEEYLVATLDGQDALFVRNMKENYQVIRYLAPSVEKLGGDQIPKNRKKKKR